MVRRLACPKGHKWDVADRPQGGDTRILCPVCGTAPLAQIAAQASASIATAAPSGRSAAARGGAASVSIPQRTAPLATLVPRPANLPVVPGYEVLGELGR